MTSCQKASIFSLRNTNKDKVIALQPLGEYNVDQLELIRNRLKNFFNIRVIILPPLNIPLSFSGGHKDKYCADSLLWLLSKDKNDSIVEVIGVTHKEIYTFQKVKAKEGDKSVYANERVGVYGLGDLSGSSCVVSDYKFMTNDTALLNTLIQKAILHEIGHNLGLEHCSVRTCLMAEADGDVSNLIQHGDDYCKKCRQKLK